MPLPTSHNAHVRDRTALLKTVPVLENSASNDVSQLELQPAVNHKPSTARRLSTTTSSYPDADSLSTPFWSRRRHGESPVPHVSPNSPTSHKCTRTLHISIYPHPFPTYMNISYPCTCLQSLSTNHHCTVSGLDGITPQLQPSQRHAQMA